MHHNLYTNIIALAKILWRLLDYKNCKLNQIKGPGACIQVYQMEDT